MNRATKLREGGGDVSEGHEDEDGEERAEAERREKRLRRDGGDK